MLKCTSILYSSHALKAVITRSIQKSEIEQVVSFGEVIKIYPDDRPYPSYLLLKFLEGRALHVVVSKDVKSDVCVLITCYEPDPNIWVPSFKSKLL